MSEYLKPEKDPLACPTCERRLCKCPAGGGGGGGGEESDSSKPAETMRTDNKKSESAIPNAVLPNAVLPVVENPSTELNKPEARLTQEGKLLYCLLFAPSAQETRLASNTIEKLDTSNKADFDEEKRILSVR